MKTLEELTRALALKVLNNGHLHLGSFTLEEFLMEELEIDEETIYYLKRFLLEETV